MFLSSFKDVTGMSSCPSNDNPETEDVTRCDDDNDAPAAAMVEGSWDLDLSDAGLFASDFEV